MLKRIPTLTEILQVAAVIALLVYGWTLVWYFWKLNSWLFFLSTGEILTILAYDFATNLLECLVVLIGPILLALLLPAKWFRERFVPQATWLVLLGLGYLMAFSFQIQGDYPAAWIAWSPLVLAGILLASFLFARFHLLKAAAELLADRALVFLYLILPLTVVSLITVLIRIVW